MILPLTILLAAAAAGETPSQPPAIGAQVASFTLTDIHRRGRSIADYKDAKAIVIVFAGTECPLANLYVPTLKELHEQYSGKGVQFLIINANVQDSFLEVSAHTQEREIPFPVLKDFSHTVADQFGATRTPEAFVLDAQRVIRYHGRIDDQYAVGVHREKPTRRDLQAALDELLAGKPVSASITELSGCIIGRADTPRLDRHVTYAKDVSRILQNRCQACHRTGQIGPMALASYDDAKAWAKTIHEVVLQQRMPPWHADPRFGKFSNDRQLSDSERDTILAWVEQDCPKGDDKDLPPPKEFPESWTIGKPDAVYTMAEEFRVPASGVINYKRFIVDPAFEEDVWVQAAECRPGNRAVVHHILVYIQQPLRPIYSPDGTAMTLAGWAPGDMPAVYPSGTARKVPAGAKLVFEVHYTPNGTEQSDRSSVGVIFAKQPPDKEVDVNILANLRLRVPANAANHKGELVYTFPKDATVLSFMPHMHLRGTSARYDVAYPDGRRETLLNVPDFDFGWQSIYRFREPLKIPKGTKLTWTGWWDNSPDNPRNPDASKEVRWGEQTWDEMQNGWMDVVWEK